MKRAEHFYVGEKEVSKELWFEVYNDFNNLETLTIKYEDTNERDYSRMEKELQRLKNEVNELKKKRNNVPFTLYTYPYWNSPDWTIRPEYEPFYKVYCKDAQTYQYDLNNANQSIMTFTTIY